MALTIPNDKLISIVSVAKLADEKAKELVSFLKAVPLLSSETDQILMLAKEKDFFQEDLEQIIEIIRDLAHIKELAHPVKLSVFVEDIIEGTINSIKYDNEKKFQLSEKELSGLQTRLIELLSIAALKVDAKAAVLLRDGERRYCHAKILSDIRPVFDDDDLSKKPAGAVITHLLKLAYHVNEAEHKDIYVLLDTDDLESLREVINRASEKNKTLQKFLKDTGISDLS